LLELRAVTKRYGAATRRAGATTQPRADATTHQRAGARTALDGISLELRPGEVFGLLGPNGAGKTTLLRIAVDLLRPDSGELRLFGERPGPLALGRIGYLPEERGLPARARALELLTYLGELKGARRESAREQARGLLQRVQLDQRDRARIGELSKGNQQKIQIAAALMGEPRLLLLDEPFSGLDPVNRALAIELFQESAARGCALLISTHQLEHVEQLCQRILLLHQGRALLTGTVAEVRARHADGSVLVRGTGDFSALRSVLRADGPRLFLRDGINSFLREALDRGLTLTSFEPALPTLEEIFVRAVAPPPGQPGPQSPSGPQAPAASQPPLAELL
jgi:ABC-2 type transport system ATP-binding protein